MNAAKVLLLALVGSALMANASALKGAEASRATQNVEPVNSLESQKVTVKKLNFAPIHSKNLAKVDTRILKQAAIDLGKFAKTPIPDGTPKRERSLMKENAAGATKLQHSLDKMVSLRQRLADLRALLVEAREEGRDTAALEAEIADAEDELQTMSDMTAMQAMELQEAMQRQAQTLQLLSNMMKSQHETLKAIINNLK